MNDQISKFSFPAVQTCKKEDISEFIHSILLDTIPDQLDEYARETVRKEIEEYDLTLVEFIYHSGTRLMALSFFNLFLCAMAVLLAKIFPDFARPIIGTTFVFSILAQNYLHKLYIWYQKQVYLPKVRDEKIESLKQSATFQLRYFNKQYPDVIQEIISRFRTEKQRLSFQKRKLLANISRLNMAESNDSEQENKNDVSSIDRALRDCERFIDELIAFKENIQGPIKDAIEMLRHNQRSRKENPPAQIRNKSIREFLRNMVETFIPDCPFPSGKQ